MRHKVTVFAALHNDLKVHNNLNIATERLLLKHFLNPRHRQSRRQFYPSSKLRS
jgi:hypothetical protein